MQKILEKEGERNYITIPLSLRVLMSQTMVNINAVGRNRNENNHNDNTILSFK